VYNIDILFIISTKDAQAGTWAGTGTVGTGPLSRKMSIIICSRVINMSRHAREKGKSGILHIMLRGINRQTIFEKDEDREKLLSTIERYKAICKYKVYGYCLMNNHVHLLLKETEEPISKAIKRICSSYVYWYNHKYERCGHLFQERYKSEAVEDDAYLLTVLRYIHQNPVKSGMSRTVGEYKWSSYNEYIFNTGIVDSGFVLQIFSTDLQNSIDLFIKYTNEVNKDKCLDNNEKVRCTDNEAKELLAEFGVNSITELQQLEMSMRNEMIKRLKFVEGISIRQLSRLTGISKSVIDRI